MNDFDFERLRRWPDVEADNLFAVDASDRLILDEAAESLAAAGAGEVVVLEDHYGALTLGAAALHQAQGIRVHQDALSGEQALAANAAAVGLTDVYRSLDLVPELLAGARVVLLQLPRSLSALDEIAGMIALHAAPDVRVFAGGRIKHMTSAMNEVLGRHFIDVRASRARQKSRVLVAAVPRLSERSEAVWPECREHADLGLTVCAHGAAFAGTSIDIGTRFLLEFLDRMKPDASSAIDLGSGTGVLAASLAMQRPGIRVI
ncbi:MAG TPA: methyltransferase, partial [Glaciibacter sp.]|nr:methyltransferase [Glaciibacter sp.]